MNLQPAPTKTPLTGKEGTELCWPWQRWFSDLYNQLGAITAQKGDKGDQGEPGKDGTALQTIEPYIISSDFTLTIDYIKYVIAVNCLTPITITLPKATGTGNVYKITNIGTIEAVILAQSGEKIMGENSQNILPGEWFNVYDVAKKMWVIGL
jgi:hypothetical protein